MASVDLEAPSGRDLKSPLKTSTSGGIGKNPKARASPGEKLPNASNGVSALVSLPPLPEGGEVEERVVVNEDNQDAPVPDSEPAGSRKSAGSSEKEAESEGTTSAQSPPPVSPRNKRKRADVEDSGTSKAEEAAPSRQKAAYDPYLEALISSGDEEEVPAFDVAARPMIKELIRIGAQFIGYREYASKTEGIEQADAIVTAVPYFFKKTEPKTFLALAKDFNPPEDLGLKMRQ
ncbi:hypothetical protein QYE76_005621 [Lolium multiflorum]|uniref:Uncharacterized protein n=1 Tax=Lolium multiflorum TaxID=4521 RepID=A0AAD8W3K8_LOLMU|nr:hypothetical protein QYE76_005621 [Lolium multiflorum]